MSVYALNYIPSLLFKNMIPMENVNQKVKLTFKYVAYAFIAFTILALLVKALTPSELQNVKYMIEQESKTNSQLVIDQQEVQQKLDLSNQKLKDLEQLKETILQQQNNTEQQDIAFAGNFKPVDSKGIAAFLSVNGADFVKDREQTFIDVAEHYNLKPELLVCIAQADSSLGLALKTKNNIGNVGNDDSNNTKSFATLDSAIEAMAQTLNNQYMRGNTTLGQLSQGGRNIAGSKYNCSEAPSPYKCYASSPVNWNKNVKSCLQNIFQDTTINESFNFRTI